MILNMKMTQKQLNWDNAEKTWFNIGISFDTEGFPVFDFISYNSVLYKNPKLMEFETKLKAFLESLEAPKKAEDDFDNYPDDMEFC